ncbi:hypothetical protein [Actinomadura sp. DC4]|nr:hypothetical protein [Actinomadura sp. DC4]MDN3356333.1 hypothetical protein [Actinomadura sp. DC4]
MSERTEVNDMKAILDLQDLQMEAPAAELSSNQSSICCISTH